jgi:hypothetical protein
MKGLTDAAGGAVRSAATISGEAVRSAATISADAGKTLGDAGKKLNAENTKVKSC